MRNVDYKYEVLRNHVPIAEIHAVGTPVVRHQSEAVIPRTLKGAFAYDVGAVNWFTDRIRPSIIIDGVSYPLGVYVVSTASESYRNGFSVWDIQAMDQTLLLKQTALENVLHYDKGSAYYAAITGLLSDAGVKVVLGDASEDVMPTEREDWEIGDTYLTVINALLSEIGFNNVWFDSEGIARMTRYVAPNASNIKHTYKTDSMSVIESACTVERDIYNPYNVFMALVSNTELLLPLRAVAVNDDPVSPISTIALGRRIMAPVEKLNNIASLAALQAHVERRKEESKLTNEIVKFTTANMPGHEHRDVIALAHERIQGIYLETEWEMQLSYNGKMTHKARRMILS